MLTVHDVLQHISDHLDKILTLEGVLVAKGWMSEKTPYYIVPSKDDYADIDSALHVKPFPWETPLGVALGGIHSVSHGLAGPSLRYKFVDDIQTIGRLVKSEQVPYGVAFDIQTLKLTREYYICHLSSGGVSLNDVGLEFPQVVSVNEVAADPMQYLGKTIALEGMFFGSYKVPIYYLAPIGLRPVSIRDEAVQEKSILVDYYPFLYQLMDAIGPRGVGTELHWQHKVWIEGEVTKTNQTPFSVSLTNVSKLAIETGGMGKMVFQLLL